MNLVRCRPAKCCEAFRIYGAVFVFGLSRLSRGP